MSPYYLNAPPSFYIYNSQVIVLSHSYIYQFGVCVIIYG